MRDIKFMPWWHEAISDLERQDSTFPKKTDVVVIGSGYTGLSCALTLARAGREVLILEAGKAGEGASTRNGGQLGSGNQKFTVQKLVDLHGRKKATALINAGTDMLRYIEDLINTEKIECCFKRNGRFRGAIKPGHYDSMAKDMEDLKKFAGIEYYMVPRSDQRSEVDTDYYHGGSVLPNDASLHPGLYHCGLLERVLAAGAAIREQTPAQALKREGNIFRINSPAGEISAGDVVVACNGYIKTGTKVLKPGIVPVGSSIIATEELPVQLLRQLMPTGRVYGNTARVIHYFRTSPDGQRLLFGGRMGHFASQTSYRAYQHLRKEMLAVFPVLEDKAITHCWSGYIGYTRDSLPHIGKRDGVWYAAGYCGTGVSRSTWFGNKLALKILGDPAGNTVFDDIPITPFRFRWAAPVGVLGFEAWYRLRDVFGR